MKVGIVGAGIFGITTAVLLAREKGYEVTLYDKSSDILMGASLTNQFRVHKGYHYPRSKETISRCLGANASFIEEYKEAIINDHESYYCVSKDKTLTVAENCEKVWKEFGLDFEKSKLDLINESMIDATFKVTEDLLDYAKLKKICWERLRKYNIDVRLNKEVFSKDLEGYDFVVIATYALNNDFLEKFPEKQQDYQYELCEKVLLELPPKYKGKSIVIMDGPFMCIDPYGRTGLHLMGNVVHAIHNTNIGKRPIIPEQFKGLLNKGIIKNPPITNISKLLESAEQFFPGIKNEAKHMGSKYTFRTVLPNRESDDARPTIVKKIDGRTFTIFSGKIPTCVEAANLVMNDIEKYAETTPNSLPLLQANLQ